MISSDLQDGVFFGKIQRHLLDHDKIACTGYEKASPDMDRPQDHIKSRQRVADHGEVFTPAWMVAAMLDLVKEAPPPVETRRLPGETG